MIDWVLTARLAAGITAVMAVALVATCIAMAASLRSIRRAQCAETERARASCRELGTAMAQLAVANLTLHQFLASLTERVEKFQHLASTQTAPATDRAYELAARLAAGGAPASELVANCGLTRAEAELAVLVHGDRPRPAH